MKIQAFVCGLGVLVMVGVGGCGSGPESIADLETGRVQQALSATALVSADSGIFSEQTAWNGGANPNLAVGRTRMANNRRALLKFDLSSIPTDATVTAVTLRLNPIKQQGSPPVTVHKVSSDWGEGTSVTPGPDSGKGAAATTGAVTWSHRKYTANAWTSAGGDAASGASTSFTPTVNVQVAKSDAALASDVQGWVTSPSTNFGWLLKSSTTTNQNAVLFGGKGAGTNAPSLDVTYSLPPCHGVVCNSPGACQASPGTCNAANGTCTYPAATNGTTCYVGGNHCTPGTCQSGSCSGGAPVQCSPQACKDGVCNSSTGSCTYTPNASLPCDDGNPATIDSCNSSGVCVGTTRTGNLWSWGDGTKGALGLSSLSNVATPTKTGANLTMVAAGETHTLGVDPDGNLFAWGSNDFGQLGTTASTTPTQTPAVVTGYGGYAPLAIAAGKSHSMVVSPVLGQLVTFGGNASGQLGDPAAPLTNRPAPTAVPNMTGVIAVAAGNAHSIVLRADGSVWTFGENSKGQLGNNDTTGTDKKSPVEVTLMPVRAKAIAAGAEHTLALGVDGNVYGWGSNNKGAIGQPQATANVWKPTKVGGISLIKGIAAAGYHSVALTVDGAVKGWGDNTSGAVGSNDSALAYYSPVAVVGPSERVRAVAAGVLHGMCAGVSSNTVRAWGRNVEGQLGYSTPVNVPYSLKGNLVRNGQGDIVIAAGGNQSFAITNTRTLFAWGSNTFGKLGTGSGQPNHKTPATVPLGHNVLVATTGQGNHAGALESPTFHELWGSDAQDQIGWPLEDSATPRTPNDAINFGVLDLKAGGLFNVMLRGDGTVWTMGYNANGELGNGKSPTNSYNWEQVMVNSTTALSNVVEISPGTYHALALTADGNVYAWGHAGYMQIGRSGSNALYAEKVTLSKAVRAISAGFYASYALMGDGTVTSWGLDTSGQLGDGTPGGMAGPTAVQGVSFVSQVAGGGLFGLALSGGGIMAWGDTSQGQLGTLTGTPVDPPASTLGYPIARQIAAGGSTMYFLNIDGTVFARGYDSSGELGNGTINAGGPNWVVASNLNRVVSITAGAGTAMAIKQP